MEYGSKLSTQQLKMSNTINTVSYKVWSRLMHVWTSQQNLKNRPCEENTELEGKKSDTKHVNFVLGYSASAFNVVKVETLHIIF